MITISQRSSSANSSADPPAFLHEVFLSFHGKDTRSTFTGYLYEALTGIGIKAYRDDEDLRQGRFIRPELLQAIESSASAVVVFSPNYAYSKWCLDELAHIVKCKEERELLVYPVFYHVEPSDVRHWRDSFGRAFDEHEGDSGISDERLGVWKSAFRKVGEISGWHITGDGYEHKHVSDIVRRINQDLLDVLPRDIIGDLVGIESQVQEVYRILCLQSNDVRFVGIYGMSGTGKTFLAHYMYNRIRNQFECCSFIQSIKDVSVETDDFRKLQQQILDDLLRNNNIRVTNVMDGVALLQKRLRGRKSLLVLDDVNSKDQLKHLARERGWFGNGSRIIITTTNEDVLKAHGVADDQKYKCDLLGYDDARRLFCKEAFGEERPKQGFEELTDDILRLAGGLPLAIVVFGSALSGEEDKCCWMETVQMLQQYPDKDITGRLEVGYRRLDRHEQEIFIYLACFFEGSFYSDICNTLKDIGLYPTRGINVLRKRSLVNVQSSRVYVHEQLRHMCWEILRKTFPSKPGNRIALKSRRDIVDIMTSKKGGEAIQIINDELYDHEEAEKFCGHRKAFSKMTRLMILKIRNVIFQDGIEYLSSELRLLDWYGCSLKSFPPSFEPRHLIKLLMPHSKLEHLWENVIDMPNLEYIDLSHSEKLIKIPDLSMTPKLKYLYLKNCTSLVQVHQSVFVHNGLAIVTLEGCKCLESLGSKSIDMEALCSLNLSDCSNLQMIPEFGERTSNLQSLYLDRTSLKKLPDSVGVIRSLSRLSANGTDIQELPSSICQLEWLRYLHVSGCRYLSIDTSLFVNMQKEIPMGLDLFECILSGNDFVTISLSICDLCSSARLCILDCCKNLQTLPKLPRSIKAKEYELEVDFHYYTSAEELDMSPYDIRPYNPAEYKIVSCLNCPRLVENESGHGGVAVTILKKYMQVGSILKDIPQASFEIAAAGSEISPWFSNHGTGNSVRIEFLSGNWYDDAWIGIALCAVVHRAKEQNENYMPFTTLKAHIHADGKVVMIPLPICLSICEFELENQIVRFVSVSNYLRQSVDWSRVDQLLVLFDSKVKGWEVKSCAARMVYKTDLDEFAGGDI